MARRYLDVASAAAWHPAALAAYARVAEQFPADPARAHREGRAARDLLERARAVLADTVGGQPERVVLTGSGTEAVHLAVRGAADANRTRPPRVVSAAVEHSAVLAAADASGCEHVRVAVDGQGRVDLAALERALAPGAVLVNLQDANHEVGTRQPVAAAAAVTHAAGALLHVDACQTVGRVPVDMDGLGADFLSLSAAKFGGGRGVGALVLSPGARLAPQLRGDDRERGRRAGLEHLPGVAAMAEALLQLRPADPEGPAAVEAARADGLRRRLRAALRERIEDVAVHGPEQDALPHIVAFSVLYAEGQALVDALDRAGFAVHSGSSCAATAGEPSHVLVAMRALTHGHVRVSFGPDVGAGELEAFTDALVAAVAELRARSWR